MNEVRANMGIFTLLICKQKKKSYSKQMKKQNTKKYFLSKRKQHFLSNFADENIFVCSEFSSFLFQVFFLKRKPVMMNLNS